MALSESKIISKNNSSINKSPFNPEMIEINKNILFFKNEILGDLRKMEERLSIKITEQSVINSEQYYSLEKKYEELSTFITNINSLVLDNSKFIDKLDFFQQFKLKAEDNLNRLNAKIVTVQKETRGFFDNIEKMINDNLRYPGVIGNKAKFLNFRQFIDYIIITFKEFDEFKQEIKNIDFNSFKKKINSDIQEVRLGIIDSSRSSVSLIGSQYKKFDSKVEDIIKNNKKMMDENENKFNDLENKINDYFSEYQTKFETIEKNINDKQIEQLNEIENLKILKNKFTQEMNNLTSNFETNKTEQESKECNNENNYMLKIINNNQISEEQKFMENSNEEIRIPIYQLFAQRKL